MTKLDRGELNIDIALNVLYFTINRYCQELQHFFAQLRNIAAYERFLIFFPCIHVCSLFAQYWPGQFHLNVFQLYLTHFRVSHLSTEREKATDMADNPFFSAPKSSGIKSLLDKDSEIPTDISFEIVDDTEIVTLKAHKLILAAHSVFFRKAFFGSGLNFKESRGTVEQWDTWDGHHQRDNQKGFRSHDRLHL